MHFTFIAETDIGTTKDTNQDSICNDFDKNIENALISPECNLKYAVNEYIEHLPHYDQLNCSDFINYSGFQKLAYLFL